MIRASNYCGFGDWPSCADLAQTGGSTDGLVVLAALAVSAILVGIAASVTRR